MNETNTLKDSCMGFELPDGKTFLIGKKDIEKIAADIFIELALNEKYKVMLIKDTGLERANKLYEVYKNEKAEMSEKQKRNCLSRIIKNLSENSYELSDLEKEMALKND